MIKNTEDWIHKERVKKIIEDGKVVMTESYHIKRGSCCGNGCKNCPYIPIHIKGNTTIFIDNG